MWKTIIRNVGPTPPQFFRKKYWKIRAILMKIKFAEDELLA